MLESDWIRETEELPFSTYFMFMEAKNKAGFHSLFNVLIVKKGKKKEKSIFDLR